MEIKKMIAVILGGLVGLGGSAYGSEPPAEGEPASVSVRVYLTEGALPVDDPNSPAWDSVAASEFNLAPQVHWPERLQEATVKSVKVRGLHNGQDMAILVEYKDPTEDAADAAAPGRPGPAYRGDDLRERSRLLEDADPSPQRRR